MPSHPLTVLIPTHGRPTLLKRTLESLKACTLPDTYHELVVIENGSRDGAEKLVVDLPERLNARYMHRERGNKSYALNEALETIEDGLVVFFDDDIYVHSTTLTAYANAAENHEEGVFFGGRLEVDREKDPPEKLRNYFPNSVYSSNTKHSSETVFLGANWAAFSGDIKRLGGFDTRFGPGSSANATGQETNMQKRMRQAGRRPVEVKKAKVIHPVPKENVTLRWLLKRRIRDGTAAGIHVQNRPNVSFLLKTVSNFSIALGGLIKGIVHQDSERIYISLLYFVWLLGVVKGYYYA